MLIRGHFWQIKKYVTFAEVEINTYTIQMGETKMILCEMENIRNSAHQMVFVSFFFTGNLFQPFERNDIKNLDLYLFGNGKLQYSICENKIYALFSFRIQIR